MHTRQPQFETPNLKPMVKRTGATLNKVSELIQMDTCQWDVQRVEAHFEPADARAICSIPLGRDMEDTWGWHLEKDGCFSVRSTCRALITKQSIATTPGGSGGDVKMFWRKLWGLSVPPKVRSLWWRVIKKYILCKAILKERHME